MPRSALLRALLSTAMSCTVAARAAHGQRPTPAQRYALQSAAGLRLHQVTAEGVTYAGKRGVRVTTSPEAERRVAGLPLNQQAQFERLAVLEGSDFADGVIEAEVAGAPAPGAPAGARGFVGVAFRVQPDLRTYDAFYLRPTNGRADDQERRNHAAQYIAHPAWTWSRLRRETPSKYEAYVDLVPGAWTRVRIEVRGDTARLFVHDQAQPTLIVRDVKSGAQGRGAIALWIDAGTVAHFRDLRVRPAGRAAPRSPAAESAGGVGGDPAERPRRVLAHERLGVGQRGEQRRDVVICPDVAERHRGVALEPAELGPHHRRAAERLGELVLGHA